MYSLPDEGRLIDSPGVWEYGLWDITPIELSSGFPEFEQFAGHCKFNDCQHHVEPGCLIAEAAESNQILSWRYESYLRLLEQSK